MLHRHSSSNRHAQTPAPACYWPSSERKTPEKKDETFIEIAALSAQIISNSIEATSDSAAEVRDAPDPVVQQQRLRQVERKLRNSLELSNILGAAVVESAALLGARQVVLLEYQADAQCWQQVAQYCQNQSLAWRKRFSIVRSESPDLMRQLVQNEAVQLYAQQPLPTTETRQWLACWPGSWLLVPVRKTHDIGYSLNAHGQIGILSGTATAARSDDDDHWGVMALSLAESDVWRTTAVACAQSIAVELSLAIAQSEKHQSLMAANQALQKLALLDGLTSLANRRCFDEHLASEWQRLARDRQPLSLILCDLDNFKRYNDSFGHPAGDRCLKKVSNALLKGPQRPADLVARYGGEEFAIILPNTDTNGAWRIAQKIHDSVRALKIAHAANNDKPYVTVTMGVSTIVPGHDTTAQILVQAADLALYHAKKQGRDRTYIHAHYNTVNSNTVNPNTVNPNTVNLNTVNSEMEESAITSGKSQLPLTPPEEKSAR